MSVLKLSKSLTNSTKYYSSTALPSPQLNPKIPNTKLFLNNEWVDSLQPGNVFTPINPTTGKVITEVQTSCKEDLDRAVEAARKAFHYSSPWRKMNASDRGKLLTKLSDLVERDASYISSLDALEVGKLYNLTFSGEMPFVYNSFRYMGGWCDKLKGDVISTDGDYLCYTRNEPVGVTGLISAWNFPLMFTGIKLASSLAAGNVAIVKPSKHSTLSALHLMELTKEAGFPPGVVGLVPGSSSIGKMMSDHPGIDLISITGSTKAGQDVYERGSKNIKRLILELEGKSPIIICDDIDLDKAVQSAHTAIFTNSGQCCCAASRTYVQDTIFEEFVKRSKELTRKKKIGDPFDPKTMLGPQAYEKHLLSILNMVEIGKKEGATLEVGGVRCDREGFFMEPTIFTNIKEDMVISTTEIFGPVQLISPFKTLDEAIDKANNSKYGLASSIFTKDVNKINTFIQRIRTGNVWVNCYFSIQPQAPFGGFKMSGLNRECGYSSVKAFTEEKCVHTKLPVKNS